MQFTIRTAIEGTTLVAFYFAWSLVWFRGPLVEYGYYPGLIGLASIASLVFAAWQGRRIEGAPSAWSSVATAWHLAGINIVFTLLIILSVTDTSDGVWPRDWMQGMFNGSIVSGVTLPIFLALPIACFLLVHRRQKPRPVLLFSMVASSLATAGVALVVSFAFGTLVYK